MKKLSLKYLHHRKRGKAHEWRYRRKVGGKYHEVTLTEVHGLNSDDHEKEIRTAWAYAHSAFEETRKGEKPVRKGTLAWLINDYKKNSSHWREGLSAGSKKSHSSIYDRITKKVGDKQFSLFTHEWFQLALNRKGERNGWFGAINDRKALSNVFKYAVRCGYLKENPLDGVQLMKPKTASLNERTAKAEDISKYRSHWPLGTKERLILELAIGTGAARTDLSRLGASNLIATNEWETGYVIHYRRQKSKETAFIPLSYELKDLLSDIWAQDVFILTEFGKPFTPAGLGNKFAEAAKAAGAKLTIHSLRHRFATNIANDGGHSYTIAARMGHSKPTQSAHYTKDYDRKTSALGVTKGL